MQHTHCRFKSTEEFFKHLKSLDEFIFPSRTDLKVGERVKMTVMISDVREKATFEVQVVERTTFAMDVVGDTSTRCWVYGVQPSEQDEVWLDAFVTRLHTLTSLGFHRQAA